MNKSIWYKVNGQWIHGEKPIMIRSGKDRRTKNRRRVLDRRKGERRLCTY